MKLKTRDEFCQDAEVCELCLQMDSVQLDKIKETRGPIEDVYCLLEQLRNVLIENWTETWNEKTGFNGNQLYVRKYFVYYWGIETFHK